ncbi:MAG: M23 family metallopeptidase [Eubacteriales bacterium]|nr:M23 family metallopeptidase [Eubacteriales bacterium]
MEHKKTKKKDGAGLYIAICCCILVIALIGYANNVAEKNKEEEKFLARETGENVVVPDVQEPTPLPVITPEPEMIEEVSDVEVEPVAKSKVVEEEKFFSNPVSGKVIGEFSDKQIYYESIEEWRTHNGVDIEAHVGDSVMAAADGVVSRVFMGSLGYSIQIDHNDGFSTVYSNLDEKPTVAIGDNVMKSDVIGHIGNSALADLADNAHLHFEVIKDGKYENPSEYLN